MSSVFLALAGGGRDVKNFYKINEIAKLYGVGTDSIRYYERLGLLSPRRDANGYRLYSLKELYKLNMIRDLRRLDFSMAQIKEYLDGQSVQNTLAMLRRERELLRGRIREARARDRMIGSRIVALEASAGRELRRPEVKELPERRCVRLDEYITRDEEMDLVIKKLHRKHEAEVRDFGNQVIGAFFSEEELRRGLTNVYSSVFFILEAGAARWDFSLPAGLYVSVYYRGSYAHNAEAIASLERFASERGLKAAGSPFELYEVDNRDTAVEDEFLTEVQALVERP